MKREICPYCNKPLIEKVRLSDNGVQTEGSDKGREQSSPIIEIFEGYIDKFYLMKHKYKMPPRWNNLPNDDRVASMQIPNVYKGASTFDGLTLNDHRRVKVTFEIYPESLEERLKERKKNMRYQEFNSEFMNMAMYVNNIANKKGWWKENRPESELICLIHSELSEALDAVRHHNPPSEHIPEFSGVEEELADVVIRCMDYAISKNYRLGEAICAKVKFNNMSRNVGNNCQ